MLGLLVIGLTVVLIGNLVKNALLGKQLSSDETFQGTMDLLIPINLRSEFYLEPWIEALEKFNRQSTNLTIHILIDGHHPSLTAWEELRHRVPNLKLHSYLNRPEHRPSAAWMLEQISKEIQGNVVVVGDAELVPTESAFMSLGNFVTVKGRAYFVLPQTAKLNTLGQAIALLNPSLAFASAFGIPKLRRNISNPLLSMAQGWFGMPLSMFQSVDFGRINVNSWKLGMAESWEREGNYFSLAFGEKHLQRFYPDDFRTQVIELKTYWEELWKSGDRTGFWIYLIILFIWSFPILCFMSHPFWAFASFSLLCLYRFFSKIVFQESLRAIALHPVACLVWIGTLIWWGVQNAKAKYGLRA